MVHYILRPNTANEYEIAHTCQAKTVLRCDLLNDALLPTARTRTKSRRSVCLTASGIDASRMTDEEVQAAAAGAMAAS